MCVLRLRVGAVLRELDRSLDDLVDLVLEFLPLTRGELELLAEADDRVALRRAVAILLGAVDLRVADVVAVHAVGLDVEEHRPGARAHVVERLGRAVEDLLDVLPVDLDRVHVVGERPLRHVVPDGRVLPAGRRLGPLVVLADKQGLRAPELRQVERLVEGAGVRRAVAEERDRHPRLLAQLECEPGADDRTQAAADHRVRAEVAALDVVEVHRAAVAVRAALHLPVELGHDGVRVRAPREGVAVRAMGGTEDVTVLHRGAVQTPTSAASLADRDVQETGKIPGAETLLDLLLEAPDQEHLAQEPRGSRSPREPALLLHLRHGSECTFCARWHSSMTGRLAEAALPAAVGRRAGGASRLEAGKRRPSARSSCWHRSSRCEPGPGIGIPADRRSGRRWIHHWEARHPGLEREALRRALQRLDAERLHGTLAVGVVAEREPQAAQPAALPTLSLPDSWDAALAALPADWSDLLGEIELGSSDYLEPGAVQLAPINPRRVADTLRLQFRSASHFGYGASPGMVRRCLERCDAAGITGRVEILRVLSDSRPVGTQGPVWHIDGQMV